MSILPFHTKAKTKEARPSIRPWGPAALVMFFLFSLLALTSIPTAQSLASGVTLAWNPSPDPAVSGYRLYYGNASGRYDSVLDVGPFTSCSISGLEEGRTYFFAATAYDVTGIESDFSNEVVFRQDCLWGDADGDGRRDVRDVQMVVNILLGSGREIPCADLDGNKIVDIRDLQQVVNLILSR